MSWQLLLGYLPTNSERRVNTIERKRREYLEAVRQSFGEASNAGQGSVRPSLAALAAAPLATKGRGRGLDEAIWHQISIDVPRTNPHIPLYAFEATQRSLERILYLWAVRHPASGYVQGINDLATPFWQVFLSTYITDFEIDSGMDPGQLPRAVLDAVEADSFWCLTKLLDGIQDNYIHAQPGIHRQISALQDLVSRIDTGLAKHLEAESVEYMQFSFRWMNCLLMRELSMRSTIRMWDTYLVCHSATPMGFTDGTTGRGEWVFTISSVCLRSFSGEMVRSASQDEFSGNPDVPAGAAHTKLVRERYGTVAERGVHLAESVQGISSTFAQYIIHFVADWVAGSCSLNNDIQFEEGNLTCA